MITGMGQNLRILAVGVAAVALAAVMPTRVLAQKVTVKAEGAEVELSVDGKLFTRYTMKSAPNKPVFYPILTENGSSYTRRWPVEPDADPTESHDHIHHRGLWFTHSKVNGVDFWSEEGTVGKTRTTSITGVKSGKNSGSFTAHTDWVMPDGSIIAEDTRTVVLTALPDGGRLLDFNLVFKPKNGPVLFGDNKDGVFGLRVRDSLAINPAVKPKVAGTGHIRTSTGTKDTDAWGKHADWVDYYGPIKGETYGVAIFDSPANFRHPQTWHARDYSLFTVNPFGLHDFGLGDKGAGDLTVPAGGSLRAHYRVYFHRGDTEAAGVAQQYSRFAAENPAR